MKIKMIYVRYLGLALALGTAIPAQATLLWNGAASGGTGIFKGIERQTNGGTPESTNGSTLTAVADATEGTVWKFYKHALDKRCEARGATGLTISNGNTYYIGYRFKVPEVVASPALGHYYAMSQWKSYGASITQNYPVLVTIVNGNFRVQHFPPDTFGSSGGITLFTKAVSPNVWYSVVIKIKTGNTTTTGDVQVWWGNDSTAETLVTGGTNYVCRTFEGTIEPKWGYYHQTDRAGTIFYSRLKIGTTWADVKPY